MSKLKIALDYDRTYTADKCLWDLFVDDSRCRGHEVKFVTWRFEDASRYADPKWRTNDDIEADAKELGIDIIYCNHGPKQKFYDADIWIDDQPATITTSAILLNTNEARQ